MHHSSDFSHLDIIPRLHIQPFQDASSHLDAFVLDGVCVFNLETFKKKLKIKKLTMLLRKATVRKMLTHAISLELGHAF